MMHRAILAGVAALVLSSTAALADRPGKDWMNKADVIKGMEAQGYSGIIIEADDGRWEGEAIKDGRIVEFHADPRTGKITRSRVKTAD